MVVYDSVKFDKYQREGLRLESASTATVAELTEEQRLHMFLDQGCLSAPLIVANPEEVLGKIRGRYQVIFDSAKIGTTWDNFDRALKIMAEKGWRLVAISSLSINMGIYFDLHVYGVLERRES